MEQLTPAQAHYRRVMAAHRDGEQTAENMTAYEQILHRLRNDLSRLSDIQGTDFKIEYKKTVLGQYEPWIDGVIAANTGVSDEVFTTVLVWQIDCGNYDRALDMADYVLAHNLPLPERYHRTPAVMVIDEIGDRALTLFAAGVDAEQRIPLAVLERLDELTANYDVPNEVRAKLCKALAYTLRVSKDTADKERALELLRRAILLHEKSGVKRDIELLQRELEKADDDTPDTGKKPETVTEKPQKKPGSKGTGAKKTTTARKKAAS